MLLIFEALKEKKSNSKKQFRRDFTSTLFNFSRDSKTSLLFLVNPSGRGISSWLLVL